MDEGQKFIQRRDGVAGAEQIYLLQFGGGEGLNKAALAGQALQCLIMKNHGIAVAAALNVTFNGKAMGYGRARSAG